MAYSSFFFLEGYHQSPLRVHCGGVINLGVERKRKVVSEHNKDFVPVRQHQRRTVSRS